MVDYRKENSIISRQNAVIDKLIWLLTTFLFASFVLLAQNVYASYILMAVSAVIFCLYLVQTRGVISLCVDPFHIHVLLFAAFCILSTLWAQDARAALTKGVTVVEILICMSLLYLYYRNRKNLRGLLMSVKWGSFVTTTYSFFFYGWDTIRAIIRTGDRLSSNFANINTIAMLSAIGLVIVIYQWLYEGFSWTVIFSVPSILVISASGSRKALVLLACGVLVLLLVRFSTRNILRNLVKYIAIAAGAILVIRLVSELSLFAGLMSRMEGLIALVTGEGVVDSSAAKRDMFMRIAFDQFFESPIWGVGMDNAKYVIGERMGLTIYSHNNFAEIACNGGILGLLAYYSMHAYIIKTFIKYRRHATAETAICFVLLLLLLIMDWGMVSYYSKSTYFYLMLFFLQAEKMKRTAREGKPLPEGEVVTA